MRLAGFFSAALLSAAAAAVAQDVAGGDSLFAVAELTTATTGVTGRFAFAASSAQGPLQITVDLAGLNSSEPYYLYHVHEKPMDATGSCLSTGIHLDPDAVGQGGNVTDYKCDRSDFSTCELGDLSGKFGAVYPENATFPFTVTDPEAGMADPSEPGRFVVGRSVVVHAADGARVSCGNIVAAAAPAPPGRDSSSGAHPAAGPAPAAASAPPLASGAGGLRGSAPLVLAAAAASGGAAFAL